MTLTELQTDQFQCVASLLNNYTGHPVVNAVIEGNSPGRVFVDNRSIPQSAFVLTNAGFSFLCGSSKINQFNRALKDLLDNQILPEIQESDDPTLIFYPLSAGWKDPLMVILEKRKSHDLFRKQFKFNLDKFRQLANQLERIPADFKLHQIDQKLLEQIGADMFPWESRQAFLDKGFGFWLLAGEEIACECSSVFVGGNAVEISIHTQKNFQRRGFALITASATIKECLVRGLRPNWECWWENEPSIKLAIKLGFKPIGNHPVYLLELCPEKP